jgi:hypothetical protein
MEGSGGLAQEIGLGVAAEATSAEDVARGVAGGAILGLPLVYTQETWLHGRSVSPVLILSGSGGSVRRERGPLVLRRIPAGADSPPGGGRRRGDGAVGAARCPAARPAGPGRAWNLAGERAGRDRPDGDPGEPRLLRGGGARAGGRGREGRQTGIHFEHPKCRRGAGHPPSDDLAQRVVPRPYLLFAADFLAADFLFADFFALVAAPFLAAVDLFAEDFLADFRLDFLLAEDFLAGIVHLLSG